MKTFTFVIGSYTDRQLPGELARALAAGKRAAAPDAVRKKEKQELLRRVAGGVVCIAVAVWVLTKGQTGVMPIFAALVALLGAVLVVLALLPGSFSQKKAANALLKSLNQIESRQKARVQFSADKMSIHAAGHSVDVPFDQLDAVAITPQLCVLLHGGAATVLQKRDLVAEAFDAFAAALRQELPCAVVEIS